MKRKNTADLGPRLFDPEGPALTPEGLPSAQKQSSAPRPRSPLPEGLPPCEQCQGADCDQCCSPLPEGKFCSDCFWYQHCQRMHGRAGLRTYCVYRPSKFGC